MSKKIILIVLALPFIVIAAAYLLPNQTEVSRSIVIERDANSVFDMVNNFKNAQLWSPWAEKDKDMEVTYSGPVSSGGARMSWKSENPQVGSGSQEIIESKPLEFVHIRLAFDGQEDAEAFFKLEPQGDAKTKLTWSFIANHGENPINRYMGLMFDTWVGADYEKGLASLKTLLEKGEMLEQQAMESKPADKIQMVDENGRVMELTEEEMKALNEKSAQQEAKKAPAIIEKQIEESIKQEQLELERAKRAEQQAKALEEQSLKNNEVKSQPSTGKENY